MHDPRYGPALGVTYALDATPGQHTQAAQDNLHPDYESDKPDFGAQRKRKVRRR